jgi:hypothetical protein
VDSDAERMRITFSSKLVNSRVKEGSACSIVASFFDDSTDVWSASTPTNARYRIDRINGDPNCSQEVLAWTSLVPATSNTLAITGAQNALQSQYCDEERRQIVVEADLGLATQCVERFQYWIKNLAGVS